MNNKAFSLVELLVIIAIIGILMSITTLDFNAWQRKAQIERQTRELFAEFNQARIDSLYSKRRHSIFMQPNSYTFRRYSSENEDRSAGTAVRTKNVSYQITKETGSPLTATDYITEFNIRGFTNDNNTFRINPAGTAAMVDCILISAARTNLGKMEGGSCVAK